MLKHIQYFARVAETGSFTATAREFAVGQPLVSKAVQNLEAELGVKLFNRSTRGLTLTEEGEAAYQKCLRLIEDYENLLNTREVGEQARGLVRVSVPMTLGVLTILPALKAFLADHPGILLDLKLSDAFSDLISEGVDIAVRVGEIKDNRLVVKPVGKLHRELVASKAYVQQFGEPLTPADLKHHHCIVSGARNTRRQWAFKKNGKKTTVSVSGPIAVDSMLGIQSAVLADLGIALAGELVFKNPHLRANIKPLLPDYETDPLPFNIIYTQNQYIPLRVRVTIDFLAGLLGNL